MPLCECASARAHAHTCVCICVFGKGMEREGETERPNDCYLNEYKDSGQQWKTKTFEDPP